MRAPARTMLQPQTRPEVNSPPIAEGTSQAAHHPPVSLAGRGGARGMPEQPKQTWRYLLANAASQGCSERCSVERCGARERSLGGMGSVVGGVDADEPSSSSNNAR